MTSIVIIEDNNDFIIIDKPANLSFHSDQGTSGAFELFQQKLNIKLWPVHRLDKITSGLLILAKHKAAAITFGQLFEQKQILKTYLAISDKKPNKKQGKISGDMQKSRNGNWKLTQSNNNPAITQFISRSLVPGKRIFWVSPLTGKTHQIRVALKAVGAPILGDTRYSGTTSDRGYLHAYKIEFVWQGKLLTFTSLPNEGEFFVLPEMHQAIIDFEKR